MTSKHLLAGVLLLLFGCTKEEGPLIPVEIAITSKSGILEIHYAGTKIDTLTKKQGLTTISTWNNDLVRIKRICPEPGVLEYNIKTPTSSQLTVLQNDGDENRHKIHY